ncbi:MAG: Na+/H+ antiporter NhaA [Clostridia bacterium]|nr:Na+/H+ antiporter NhaA [Clostridia bacterium]
MLNLENISRILQEELSDFNTEPSMLHQLEHDLEPWAAFGAMPIFALANAGVTLDLNRIGEIISNPVSIGIIAGLVIGKQLGIFGFSYLMLRSKVANLPNNVSLSHLYGVSLVGGIGFTMSLFIATLAFQDENLLAIAKISIIIASILSAAAGMIFLNLRKPMHKKRARSFTEQPS